MPSLCSPDGSLPEDDLAFMTLTMDDDMDLRAPYISMSEQDDLPLLISDDLMWGAHPESVNTMAKELKNAINKQQQQQLHKQQVQSLSPPVDKSTIDSSLAALLCGTTGVAQQQQQQPPLMKAVIDQNMTKKTALDIEEVEENHIVNPIDVLGRPFKCKKSLRKV